jgi:hypothetical protein
MTAADTCPRSEAVSATVRIGGGGARSGARQGVLMQREVRLLKDRAIDSLTLAVELFNRPRNEGRVEAVLIHLDHAFEMLMKAAIRHRGGRIRKPRDAGTIGFKECVGKCLSDASLKCLREDQALSLQMLNGWRDAAQHHILELPEDELYIAAQGAVTLFDDLLVDVFGEHLRDFIPDRVLPISTRPPRDLDAMLDREFSYLTALIQPGSRKLSEAKARLRPLAILEAASRGEDHQPTEGELRRKIQDLRNGAPWQGLFPGVAALRINTDGEGLTFSLRLGSKAGIPVHLVHDGDASAATIAVKRVNELDFYQFGFADLAARLGAYVSRNKLVAVIRHLKLTDCPEYFKEFTIGRMPVRRYSQDALKKLKSELPTLDIEAIWQDELKRRRAP